MNTQNIETKLASLAHELQDGDNTQKQFAKRLSELVEEMEKYRKAHERPITAETLEQIRMGTPKFRPRKL